QRGLVLLLGRGGVAGALGHSAQNGVAFAPVGGGASAAGDLQLVEKSRNISAAVGVEVTLQQCDPGVLADVLVGVVEHGDRLLEVGDARGNSPQLIERLLPHR